MNYANRLKNLGTETAFSVSQDAAEFSSQGNTIYPFHLGDLDLPTPINIMDATIKAVETLDLCLKRVTDAILKIGGQCLITADHGNCELMQEPATGEPHTAHTTNPVPVVVVGDAVRVGRLADGGLRDIAPTLLDLMGLTAPAAMTGRSLITRAGEASAAE